MLTADDVEAFRVAGLARLRALGTRPPKPGPLGMAEAVAGCAEVWWALEWVLTRSSARAAAAAATPSHLEAAGPACGGSSR